MVFIVWKCNLYLIPYFKTNTRYPSNGKKWRDFRLQFYNSINFRTKSSKWLVLRPWVFGIITDARRRFQNTGYEWFPRPCIKLKMNERRTFFSSRPRPQGSVWIVELEFVDIYYDYRKLWLLKLKYVEENCKYYSVTICSSKLGWYAICSCVQMRF